MPRTAMAKAAPRRKKVMKKAPTGGRLRGRGDYTYDKPGPVGRAGRSVGRYLGALVGAKYGAGKFGSQVGERLGGLAHYVGKIFGSGDYVQGPGVKTNSMMTDQAPSFASGGATIRVRHQEYLGDVLSSATANTFDIQSYAINPGISQTFPWLSQVCESTFQQYRLNGMVFYFKSTSGNALTSTNTALGQVIMCTDYDSVDAPFTSKQQMENTEFGVSCKPSSNMIHAIECAPQLTSVSEKYVRAYGIPANTDLRLYDMGKFYIATNGCQGTNVNLGELWVSYDVTLIKAIEQPPNYGSPTAVYYLGGASKDTQPLGVPRVVVDQIGMTINSGVNRIQFPLSIQVGSIWCISYILVGASTAITPSTWSGGNGMVFQNYFIGPVGVYTNTNYAVTVYYKYAGGGNAANLPYVGLTNGTFPTAQTNAQLIINQISGNQPVGVSGV